MRLDFYYFSYQCPLNESMIRLLEEYRDKIDIYFHDISRNFELAQKMNMFYPTLIMLDEHKRYYSPLRKDFLEQAAVGIYPVEKPFLPSLSRKTVTKYLQPLVPENVTLACDCCGSKTEGNCLKKKQFLASCNQEIYGFIHIDEFGNLIGGAEYLPSVIIPYAIPHNEKTAFITCVYMSDPEFDYKSAPLKTLESYLSQQYTELLAVTDVNGVFPNGDISFFTQNGYDDKGVVFEDPDYCSLHLVSKRLSPSAE